MTRNTRFSSLAHLVAIFSLGFALGCGSEESDDDSALIAQNIMEQQACGITDVDPRDEVRACEPGNTKKTTICHVPPGNPDNAHTLCIGNAAVKHHLKNHPDYLGPCKREVPCPPPPPPGTGGMGGTGAGGAGGSAGEGGSGGSAGEGGSAGTGGMAGTGMMTPPATGGTGNQIID